MIAEAEFSPQSLAPFQRQGITAFSTDSFITRAVLIPDGAGLKPVRG